MASAQASHTKCAVCSKTEEALSKPLQRCGRCLSVKYCSPECQRTDWQTHKRSCKKPGYTAPPTMSPAGGMLDTLFGGSNLENLSKKECYIQLIDSYRLRAEDDCNFAGDLHGIYDDEDPKPEFAHFLELAEKRKGLLPGWWNTEDKAACKAMGADESSSNWANLSCSVKKSDIQEHYKDNSMPMKLRLLAEKVYGKRVQGGL